MLLDASTKTLELVLGAPTATTPLPVLAEFTAQLGDGSHPYPEAKAGLLTSTTPLAIVGPPNQGQQFSITDLSVFNADSIAQVVTVRITIAGVPYVKYQATLQPGDNLFYSTVNGFYIVDPNGNVRGIVPLPLGASRDSTLGVALQAASGTVSANGNNLLLTPPAGKRIKLYYFGYNPSAAVTLGFRFGVAGILFLYYNLLVAGSIVMKECGTKFVEGAVDEALYLNLSSGISTIWNALYTVE